MGTRTLHPGRVTVWLLVAVLLLVGSYAAGLLLTGRAANQATSSSGIDGAGRSGVAETASEEAYLGAPAEAPQADDAGIVSADKATASRDSLVITNASISLRVDDVNAAVSGVRTTAEKYGADITELSVFAGTTDPGPMPLLQESASSELAPATASITMRVPAAKLREVQEDLSELGVVLSQTASASDVTEEYVDLSARLKNLKAEEVRLRAFLDRTNKVSELLEVERELARVRGEIEATQAQVDYLERQAARATLVVSLSEPGPVVRPQGDGWGFSEAVTRGIQAAVALLNTLVTGFIAVAPVIFAGGVVWLVVRAIRRRRHDGAREAIEPAEHSETDE